MRSFGHLFGLLEGLTHVVDPLFPSICGEIWNIVQPSTHLQELLDDARLESWLTGEGACPGGIRSILRGGVVVTVNCQDFSGLGSH